VETTGLARAIQVSRSGLFKWSLQKDTRYRLWWCLDWDPYEPRTDARRSRLVDASWRGITARTVLARGSAVW